MPKVSEGFKKSSIFLVALLIINLNAIKGRENLVKPEANPYQCVRAVAHTPQCVAVSDG